MAESDGLLKRMIVSTINAREVESNRVSRLLHDDVGQVLTAVGLQLDVLKLDFKAREPDLVGRVNDIQKLLDQAVKQVRAVSYDLNPAVVERAGLQWALDRLIGRMRERYSGSIRFLFDTSIRIPVAVSNAWYKIAELALENAIRHSEAPRIEVHVKIAGRKTALEIRDSGRGFSLPDARTSPSGLGLLLMEHYASQAPIELEVKSSAGKGTTVRSTYVPETDAKGGSPETA